MYYLFILLYIVSMVIHFVNYTMDIKEKNTMNKTYSLVRVSSVSQRDNTSLNNQKKVIQNYLQTACQTNPLKQQFLV